jgi:hypothetical protein
LCDQLKHELDMNKQFESRINLLETEHSQKIEKLHQYYRERQQQSNSSSYIEEDLQLKYQAEIEQLRVSFKKFKINFHFKSFKIFSFKIRHFVKKDLLQWNHHIKEL